MKGNSSENWLENYLEKRSTAIIIFSLLIFLLLSLLSFDPKLSTGGDDASYIVRAIRLIRESTFPAFQGPLYPIFLSPFVAIFGMKVGLLKFLSIFLGLGTILLFYLSFKGRVSFVVLTYAVLFQAFNAQLVYYASQTYNEMFYLFIQNLFLFFFFRFIYDFMPGPSSLRGDFRSWIMVGFLSLLVVLSKNIGVTILLALVPFFLLYRSYLASIASIGAFALFYLPYLYLRDLLWESEEQYTRQGTVFLYKDPYDFNSGKETFSGFLTRLYDNTHIYLSKNFMKIMNLRASDVTEVIEIAGYFMVALLLFAMVRSFKTKAFGVFFISLYTIITLGITFFILQKRWDSDRLIIMSVPYLILLSLYAFFELVEISKKKYLGIVVHVVLLLMLVNNLKVSLANVDILEMKKNLRGDRYHGYTPDWVSYLMMSEWISKNIPEEDMVAVRKQTMSIVFSGGRDFYSISRVPSSDPKELFRLLKENNVKYVMTASLRRNPKERSEYTINTVERYISIIEGAYPGTFTFVHQIGSSEPAALYKINY